MNTLITSIRSRRTGSQYHHAGPAVRHHRQMGGRTGRLAGRQDRTTSTAPVLTRALFERCPLTDRRVGVGAGTTRCGDQDGHRQWVPSLAAGHVGSGNRLPEPTDRSATPPPLSLGRCVYPRGMPESWHVEVPGATSGCGRFTSRVGPNTAIRGRFNRVVSVTCADVNRDRL